MSADKFIPIAGGAASAALTLAVLSGMGGALIFAYAALLPVFLVTFGWGSRAGHIAAIVGLALTFGLGGMGLGLVYLAATAVPAFVVGHFALMGRETPDGDVDWYPAGHILCHLAALGAIVTAAAAVAHWDVQGGFPAAVESYVDRILAAQFSITSDEDRRAFAAGLVPMLPGATVMSWIVMVALNAVAAQAMLMRSGRNRRPRPSYSSLDLPEWISWALVASGAVALVAGGTLGYVGRNLTMILATPFLFSGLGFIHVLVRNLAAPGLALAVVYTVIVFSGWAVLAVAGLGMIERWADLRSRPAARSGGPDEEEE